MIGKHEQRSVAINLRQNLAQHLVNLFVKFLERGSILRGRRCIVRRMLRIGQPPHHVPVEIEAGEVKEEETVVKFRELRIERAPVFGEHGVRLLQKFLVVEHAAIQRLRIFGDPLRVVFTNLLSPVRASNSRASKSAARDSIGSILIGET